MENVKMENGEIHGKEEPPFDASTGLSTSTIFCRRQAKNHSGFTEGQGIG